MNYFYNYLFDYHNWFYKKKWNITSVSILKPQKTSTILKPFFLANHNRGWRIFLLKAINKKSSKIFLSVTLLWFLNWWPVVIVISEIEFLDLIVLNWFYIEVILNWKIIKNHWRNVLINWWNSNRSNST
jgi:hypothetical protein